MNVVIGSNEYNPAQVYFTEKKANTHIPHSTFNRITYSTADFTMNGVYIQFELFVRQIEQNFNSNIYNFGFDPNHEHNRTMLSIFQSTETGILDKWMRLEHSSSSSSPQRKKSLDIIQQLRNGLVSVWKNDFHYHDKAQFQHFIIKISGVWENDGECGLTYKFI